MAWYARLCDGGRFCYVLIRKHKKNERKEGKKG